LPTDDTENQANQPAQATAALSFQDASGDPVAFRIAGVRCEVGAILDWVPGGHKPKLPCRAIADAKRQAPRCLARPKFQHEEGTAAIEPNRPGPAIRAVVPRDDRKC
jgi:hypothetical protein